MTALSAHCPALLAGILWTAFGLAISLVALGVVFLILRIGRGPRQETDPADTPSDDGQE